MGKGKRSHVKRERKKRIRVVTTGLVRILYKNLKSRTLHLLTQNQYLSLILSLLLDPGVLKG
jgi:hypothetical protein